MSDKTKEELEQEAFARLIVDEQREKSDTLYAIKLVEKLVFGMIGIILVGVLTALISLVIQNGR